ncbi:MAG: dipeptidase, partial [Longimicrobiales bacterium]
QDLALLETYYDLGARYMTLAHGGHNDIADSATPRENLGDEEAEHDGLSPFGEQVVEEMNRLGMMVDVSHISKAAMMEAALLSRAPVIASHSSTRALADHPRNMDDEQLVALAENGGVIQVVALGAFVKVDSPEKTAALDALRREMGVESFEDFESLSPYQRGQYEQRAADLESEWPAPNVVDFVNHIEHAIDIGGIDHVGISSDFDGGGGIVGWGDASETMNVTAELKTRGFSDEAIQKLWGGNLLRVWREVEAVAAEMRPAA